MDMIWCKGSCVHGSVERRTFVGMGGELLDPEYFEKYNTVVETRAEACTDAAL